MAVVRYTIANPYVDTRHLRERTFSFGEHFVRITQHPDEEIDLTKNTGRILWEGSLILAEYIHASSCCAGRSVVELGSGTGLAGIVACLLGASSVALTDYGMEQLDLLRTNVSRNVSNTHAISVAALEWSDALPSAKNAGATDREGTSYDVILGSEILYLPHLHSAILPTMNRLSRSGTEAVFSYKHRGFREEGFFQLAAENGWKARVLPQKFISPLELREQGYQLVLLRRD